MARTLTQIGIETGNVVEAYHVSQSIDAFTGVEAYDISLSGSFNMTGLINGQPGVINQLTASYAMNAGHAITASYAENAGGGAGFPFTGSAQITGSLGLTGSFGINKNISFISGSDLPSAVGATAVYAGGYTTPTIGRLFIGDSTGWQFHFSRRTSSITTDLISITDTGVIKLADNNGSSFLFKKADTSAAGTVIYTSRIDDSEGGSLRSDGYGNFSFNKSLAVGKEVAGGTSAVRLDVDGNVTVTGSITTSGVIKLADNNDSSFLFKKTDTSVSGTVIYTSRTDDTQGGSLRSDGWGNFSFNRSLAVGKEVEGGTSAVRLDINGNVTVTGSITTSNNITNSLTASWAVSSSRAISSSFAVSSSRAISSSFATTASHALNAFLPQWSTEGGNATLSQGRHVGVIPSLQYNGSSPRSITITLPNGQIGDVIEIICNNEAPPTPSHTRNLSISYPNGQIRAWGPSNKITSNGGSVSTPQTNTEQPTVRLIYTENNRWNIVYYMDEALATSPSASYDRLTFT